MILFFGCISCGFKHNHNKPYRHWRQDGGWHALPIVTHATAWRRELLLYTSRRQGQPLQFRAKNPRSHVIIYNHTSFTQMTLLYAWHLQVVVQISVYICQLLNKVLLRTISRGGKGPHPVNETSIISITVYMSYVSSLFKRNHAVGNSWFKWIIDSTVLKS